MGRSLPRIGPWHGQHWSELDQLWPNSGPISAKVDPNLNNAQTNKYPNADRIRPNVARLTPSLGHLARRNRNDLGILIEQRRVSVRKCPERHAIHFACNHTVAGNSTDFRRWCQSRAGFHKLWIDVGPIWPLAGWCFFSSFCPKAARFGHIRPRTRPNVADSWPDLARY